MVDVQPASRPKPPGRCAGFTLLELLLVVGIIMLAIGITLPAVASVRRSAKSMRCLANLHQISVSFHQYALDNAGLLPDPFQNKVSWEASLRPYVVSADIFVCPADAEVAPAIGSSYDWRDTGMPATTLAGLAITSVRRPKTILAFDAMAEWHARLQVNAVTLDGSSSSMDVKDCFGDLIVPVR